MSRTLPLALLSLLALGHAACLEELDLGDFGEPVGADRPGLDIQVESDELRDRIMPLAGAVQTGCDAEPRPEDAVFRAGLCLCGDLDQVGSGVVATSSSGLLGDDPGRGHVGINGEMSTVGDFNVDGTLDIARGLDSCGDVWVTRDLITGGDVNPTGDLYVGRDAWIDGDLWGVGRTDIRGDLHVTGDADVVGDLDFRSLDHDFVGFHDPCPCAASEILPIAEIVRDHRTDNDNALLPDVLGRSSIRLSGGDYYFAGENELVGHGEIIIEGDVAIYVEGDITSVGELEIRLEDGGTLDLFIEGSILTVGDFVVGDRYQSARTLRIFMGGGGNSTLNVGWTELNAAIYAPRVDFQFVGDMDINGSLFAHDLHGTGELRVHYDTDAAAPRECVEPLM